MKNSEQGLHPLSKWPKKLLPLTSEQTEIKNDFMKYWHEVLPKKYGVVEVFNNGFVTRQYKPAPTGEIIKTLEIGAGLGEHIEREDLTRQQYWVLELRDNMASVIKERFPTVETVVGDIQEQTQFPDNYFDRVVAIHVLEHLPNLPSALREVFRILKPGGFFTAVIPCEGSIAYSLARRISAKRIFEKRYNLSYDWFIQTEHINLPQEILEEIDRVGGTISKMAYFPIPIPLMFCNLCLGLDLKKEEED